MYAKDETTFQEITFNGETQTWSVGETVSNMNGHATPACNNWEQGTVDYLMMVDLHNTVNVYWFVKLILKCWLHTDVLTQERHWHEWQELHKPPTEPMDELYVDDSCFQMIQNSE